MLINADFNQRVVVHDADMLWRSSPITGIRRKMYDRIGYEVARATTLVEYASGSKFPAHTHTGGEEFIVLEGVFQDEHGDFPAGSYVRNPPQSTHTPSSQTGCLIFVKLWQFDIHNRTHLRLDMNSLDPVHSPDRSGVSITPLYSDAQENVHLEIWQPGAQVTINASGGAELLVLDGGFELEGKDFHYLSWLRTPVESSINLIAGASGARVWIKTGHLKFIYAPEQVNI